LSSINYYVRPSGCVSGEQLAVRLWNA